MRPQASGNPLHHATMLLALAAALLMLWPEAALAQRRRTTRGRSYYAARAANAQRQAAIKAAESQRDAAQAVLTAAQMKGVSAQVQLDSAVARLRETSEELRTAQSTARQLQKQLREIEEEILADQSADSPYGAAQAKLEAARRELSRAEAALLARPEIANSLAGLGRQELAVKKAELLDRQPEYAVAKGRLVAAGGEVDRIRRELFQADSDWKGTAEDLTQARKDENEAEKKAAAQGTSQLAPGRDLRKAENAAAAAREALTQAESTLKRLQPAGKKSKASSSSSSSEPKKKKKQ